MKMTNIISILPVNEKKDEQINKSWYLYAGNLGV